MNLESLGNRVPHQESEEPKERAAHTKVRAQQRAERTSECRNGACEVVWKPATAQQSGQNNIQ